jgi:putative endonuclease
VSGGRAELGRRGEEAAAEWYVHAGFTVVARNWRVREGELDLVCTRGSTVVFVEVKTRSSVRFGTGAEAVTPVKQRRIRTLALLWLRHTGQRFEHLRFDVVDVDARSRLLVYVDAF